MTTLTDVIFAVLTTVGIAVAVSLAFVLAGTFFQRTTARKAPVAGAVLAQYATQTDDARELVLR
jgi:hypothetical protein